ncbi:MAG TPA: EscU/YscU/HrcU family type III secretion system export apparatus switch protein [Miltoncostaeaceae bacterium]|nr:EscU/YscU/HrcU family type III secretion system export apparatus switch protein [Miltoncostaeaceae bacterium]
MSDLARDAPGTPPDAVRTAVALRYRHGEDPAPSVRAAGRGPVAERILASAVEAGVPVREDADLARALAALDIDQCIPPELYRVVAELLAWAYRMNQRYLLDSGD